VSRIRGPGVLVKIWSIRAILRTKKSTYPSRDRCCKSLYYKDMPRRGLEPPRLAALVPETSVYTNFTTWAGVQTR
jgi:hypothetical protein